MRLKLANNIEDSMQFAVQHLQFGPVSCVIYTLCFLLCSSQAEPAQAHRFNKLMYYWLFIRINRSLLISFSNKLLLFLLTRVGTSESSPRRGQFLQKPVINHFTGSSQRRSFSQVCVCMEHWIANSEVHKKQQSIKEETIAEHNSAVMTEWTIKSTSYKRLVATLIYRMAWDSLLWRHWTLSSVGRWTHCKFDAMQKQLHTLRCSCRTNSHSRSSLHKI